MDGDDFMEVPVKKYFRLFPGNEVRFKGAYFITCNEVVKNEDGSMSVELTTAKGEKANLTLQRDENVVRALDAEGNVVAQYEIEK